jgi:hypothetical protein
MTIYFPIIFSAKTEFLKKVSVYAGLSATGRAGRRTRSSCRQRLKSDTSSALIGSVPELADPDITVFIQTQKRPPLSP